MSDPGQWPGPPPDPTAPGQLAGDPVYVPQPYPPPGYPYGPAEGHSPYGYTYPPPPRGPLVTEPSVGWLLALIGAVTIIAALLPWASALGYTVEGTNGDGKITLVCGLVLVVTGMLIGFGHGLLWTSITSLVFSAVVGLVGLVDIVQGVTVVNEYDGLVAIEAGLWLTLVVGLLGIGLSVVALVRRVPRA